MKNKYFRHLRSVAVKMYESDILNLLEPNPEALLLDIGCDDGTWTNRVLSKIGSNRAIGVDVVNEPLLRAKEKSIRVVKSDISDGFPFSDCTFDVVHSNQVIEHLYKTEYFVTEIFRILKPGGYAIVCTENLASWHNIFSLVMGWMPMSSSNFSEIAYNVGNPLAMHASEATRYPSSWQHIRVLSIRGLKDIFELHGFKSESISGAGYYPLPSFFARIDPFHAAFLTCKFRKPACPIPKTLL